MRSALATVGVLLLGSAAAAARAEERVYSSHLMVDQEVTVASRVTGIIHEIVVDRGTSVAKDQILAKLDAREFEADAREAKEQMELARAEYERAKSLSANKVLSTADLDEKKAQYQVAVARLEKAKTLIEYTIVRAPFSGVVTEKYARVGQKVIEDQNQPLFKITATEPLLARVYLPEEALLTVRRGETVEVVAERFPNAKAEGVVRFISPTVDAASGTFQVIVAVRRDPGQQVLRPGIAVKVRFLGAKTR